jgi:hypothetical protein
MPDRSPMAVPVPARPAREIPDVIRVVALAVPVTLLVLFIGLLWLLGLVSGKGGRQYVIKISDQAMRAASVMLQGPGVGWSRPADSARTRSWSP